MDQSLGSTSSKNGDHLLQLALVEDDETKSARKVHINSTMLNSRNLYYTSLQTFT